jgi:hypothetical protein
MPFPVFKRILLNMQRSLKWFLYKQWHETITDEHAEDLANSIVNYFDLSDQIKQLAAEEFSPQTRNPPCIRIRGLLMRESKENDDED